MRAAGAHGELFGFRHKKAGLELLQASQLTLTSTLRFSSGSNNAYDACEFDNTAAQCNTFGNKDNRRSSCSNCVGNTHIPGIRSRSDMRDNRPLPRLLLSRLKPERQLVLPEPEPVRLLSMEVKEVFSYVLLFFEFPVCLCVCRGTESSCYGPYRRM